MKKIKTIAMYAMSGMLLAFSAMVLPSCNGGADGEVKFASTKLPMPLGRYVQLSRPYATFSISKPDGKGNGEMAVNFDFEILRHVPNIEYMTFRVNPNDGGVPFEVKFKKDQDAVEQLAKAIADKKTDRVSVSWRAKYEDTVESEVNEYVEQTNGAEVHFDYSTIFIEVPQSRIHVSGVDSQTVSMTKPATIHLNSDDDSLIYLELSGEASSDLQYFHPATCTIRTDDGNFEATMTNQNSYLHGWFGFGTEDGNRYYISPRDMDKLLSSPIDIYIDMK